MIAVALKGLAGRKIRALLTALAIVIGVSMVSGTFILTDTMQKSFNGLFTDAAANTDAVISGKEIVKNSTSGSGITIPASMLDKVRALPEVEAAAGDVSPTEANVADIIGKDGKAVAKESVGGSYDAANPQFSPFKFKTGKPPQGPEEVAIDAGTAAKKHYKVGDTVVVSTLGKQHTYRITGTVSFGSVDSLGFASIAAWDVKTAQTLLHREGRLRRHRGRRQARHFARAAGAGDQAAAARQPAGQGQRHAGQERREEAQRRDGDDPLGAARLRRHRAARRRLRDLQHPVDHGRPAHP